MKKVEGIPVFDTHWGTGRYYARAFGWFICCPEEHQGEWLRHEVAHCKDMKHKPWQYFWGWITDWRFRLWSEIRAHNVSHKGQYDLIARKLSRLYDIPHKIEARHVNSLNKICLFNEFKDSRDAIETIVVEFEEI